MHEKLKIVLILSILLIHFNKAKIPENVSESMKDVKNLSLFSRIF